MWRNRKNRWKKWVFYTHNCFNSSEMLRIVKNLYCLLFLTSYLLYRHHSFLINVTLLNDSKTEPSAVWQSTVHYSTVQYSTPSITKFFKLNCKPFAIELNILNWSFSVKFHSFFLLSYSEEAFKVMAKNQEKNDF